MLRTFQRNVLQIVTVRYLTSYVPTNTLYQLRNAKNNVAELRTSANMSHTVMVGCDEEPEPCGVRQSDSGIAVKVKWRIELRL